MDEISSDPPIKKKNDLYDSQWKSLSNNKVISFVVFLS